MREFGFSLISGVYGTVARIYDILIQTIETGGMYGKEGIADFAANIYVLAGVYMLFRVIIGMINMILNPDTISNEQTGAGKLLTRIIVSVLLLLAFYPTGILFGTKGLFQEVEEVVLGTNGRDGLINRIIVTKENNAGSLAEEGTTEYDSNLIYEQVSAASNSKSCYYYEVDKNTSANVNKTTLGGFVKITYRLGYKSGYTAVLNTTPEKSVYYKVSTGKIKDGEYGDYYYQNIKGTLWDNNYVFKKDNGIWAWSEKETTLPEKCPKLIRYNEKTGYANVSKEGVAQRDDIYGGYDSFTEMLDDLKIEYNQDNVETDNDILSGLGIGNGKLIANSLKNGDDAFLFAQSVAASFQDCNVSDSADQNCEKLQYGVTGMFSNIETNKKIISLEEKDFSFDFITSMLAGIGIAIYLVVLCVDVIIRKFKWMLLQVLSPIAIVSYSDPKDKIFSKWMTNLITVYVDIFIKLVAIKIVIVLLANVEAFGPTDTNLLIRFFYILAVLLFAKIVPSMISDIFGLKLGSSFKDITGMLKAGAGFATGGAIAGAAASLGAGVGIITAKGWQNKVGAGIQGLGNIVSGTLQGAAAGSKGNITSGASNILATSQRQRDARDSGSTLKGRLAARMMNAAHFSDAYETAVALRDANQDYTSAAKAYEDESLSKVNKAIGNGYGSKFADLMEARNDAQDVTNNKKVSRFRRVDNEDGTTDFINKLTGEKTSMNTASVTADTEAYFDNQLLTSAEAQARINGAEKKAAQQMRTVFATGSEAELKSYGFNKDDADYKEMAGLRSDANEAARNAGYKEYSKETKDQAKEAAKHYSAEARKHKADHDAVHHN